MLDRLFAFVASLFARKPQADPVLVARLQNHIVNTVDIVCNKHLSHGTPSSEAIPSFRFSRDLVTTLETDVDVRLQVNTFAAKDYYDAMRLLSLPKDVKLEDIRYDRKASIFSARLNLFPRVHRLKLEQVEGKS